MSEAGLGRAPGGPVRTRFAPSPTGDLHLGNVRIAVLNWAFARRHGGAFVLRFEDTDVKRRMATAERAILEGLDWLRLDRDEDPERGGPFGPYRQSERGTLYRERARALLEAGLAYRCWCLPEEPGVGCDGRCRALSPAEEAAFRAEGRRPAIRFRVDPGPVRFRDRVKGEIAIDGADFGDFVLLRSDGRPTYNFAVTVDDLAMRITHVIRGAGHLSNTPKQVLLYRALGAPCPEFVHVPTVLAPGGGKLSKREGAEGLARYREWGYHPHAVVNYVSLLSWSAEGGEEVLTPEELVRRIDLDRLGTSEPVADPEKMRWLSGRHIRREAPEALAERLREFLDPRRWGLSARDLTALAEVERERVHLFTEAAEEAERLFQPPEPDAGPAAEVLGAEEAGRALAAARRALSDLDAWEPSALHEALREAAEKAGLSGGRFFRPVRVALTGRLRGPELPRVAYVLGRARTLERLAAAGDRARALRGAEDGTSAEAPKEPADG